MDSFTDAVSRIKGNLEQILPDAVIDPISESLGLHGRDCTLTPAVTVRRCFEGGTADRISFIDALRWLRVAKPGEPVPKLEVNPPRPGRFEPRVVKRRPKPHKLMTKPRSELKKALENQQQ